GMCRLCLLRVVAATRGDGGHGEKVDILVGLDRVAFAFLNVVGAKRSVDQVLGLPGFKQVVIGDVVEAHAITDHVDDVFRASGLLRRSRSHNGSRNSQTSSDSTSGA